MKISILVPSTHKRYDNFNLSIQKKLFEQYEQLSHAQQKEVEILMFVDTKSQMLGEKRNNMVLLAKGEYVVFVDSDDRVASDYIQSLLDSTSQGKDVITFNALVSLNGEEPKLCRYSSSYARDYNTETEYHRLPNHICCFKRELAIQYPFPNILYGEDSGFSKSIRNAIKSEHNIDKILYYYDYNQETTETQYHLGSNSNAVVDIVILSNASTSRGKHLTQQAIDTAFKTCGNNPINVIVIEQSPNITYLRTKTIHLSGEFNYNKFANIGASHGNAQYIMISNNDVIFQNGWLDYLLEAGHALVSPHEPRDIRQQDIKENTIGYITGKHFSGWCFMITRKLWLDIGGFDEDFGFWYADDSVIQQCIAKNVYPMIVKKSIVNHLGSQTFKSLTREVKDNYTWGLTERFNTKYNKNKFEDNQDYQRWKISQSQ